MVNLDGNHSSPGTMETEASPATPAKGLITSTSPLSSNATQPSLPNPADPKVTTTTVSVSTNMFGGPSSGVNDPAETLLDLTTRPERDSEGDSGERRTSVPNVMKELPPVGMLKDLPPINNAGGNAEDEGEEWGDMVGNVAVDNNNGNQEGSIERENARDNMGQGSSASVLGTDTSALLATEMASLAIYAVNPDTVTSSKENVVESYREKEGIEVEPPRKMKDYPASPPPPPPPPKDRVYLDTTPRTPLPSSPISTSTTPPPNTGSPPSQNVFGETTQSAHVSRRSRRDSSSDDDDTRSEIHTILDQFEPGHGADPPNNNTITFTPTSPILMSRTNSLSVAQPRHPPRTSSLEALKDIPTKPTMSRTNSTSVASGHGGYASQSSYTSPTPENLQYNYQSTQSSTPTVESAPPVKVVSPQPSQSSSSVTLHKPPPPEPDPDLPFDFHRFLEQLRHRTADPVARYLRSFLFEFSKKQWMVHEQTKIIHDFLHFIVGKMAQCEVWREVSEQEFDNAREGMEKLVMNRLYTQTFSPVIPLGPPSPPPNSRRRRGAEPDRHRGRRGQHQEDVERDEILAQKVRIYGWVREEHLDISPVGDSGRRFLTLAKQELEKIKNYRAPRDKIICVLNCCKVIFGLLRHSNSDESADQFVPLLIYVVLQTNPAHLVSNVQYILRFRNPDKLGGEAGYYLSSLMGAIQFIESLDRSSLTITDSEFEKNVEAAVAVIAERPPSVPPPSTPSAAGTPTASTIARDDEEVINEKAPYKNGRSAGAGGSASGSAERHSNLLDVNSAGPSGSRRLRSSSPRPSVDLSSAEAVRTSRGSTSAAAFDGTSNYNQKSNNTDNHNLNNEIPPSPPPHPFHQTHPNHPSQNQYTDPSSPAVTNLLRTIQKPLSTIGRTIFGTEGAESTTIATAPTSTSTPPPPHPPSRTEQQQQAGQGREYTAQERAARQASAETAEALKIQHAEHENVVDTLAGMFPALDRKVIDLVVVEKQGRVGLAVDACLELSNGLEG